MIELQFIRHGATAGNLEKRYIGRTDEPLCAAGFAQIRELKACRFQADRLFVSPMLRTRQTAEILFPEMPCTLVPDFRETDFGIFEGKTAAELSDCPAYQTWVDSQCLDPIPQGESVSQFKARCRAAFAEILQALLDGTHAAFVVHGGVIMSILEAYARPSKPFYAYHIANGTSISGSYNGSFITLKKNQTL